MNNSKTNLSFFRRLRSQIYTDSQSLQSEIVSLSINESGTFLVNSRTDGTLRIWRCSSDKLYDPLTIDKAHESPVECVSWNPNTEYSFASVGKDRNVKVWKGLHGTLDRNIVIEKTNNDEPVVLKLVKYSFDGEILVAVDRDSTLFFLSVANNYEKVCEIKLDDYIYSLEWFNSAHSFFIVGFHGGDSIICEFKDDKMKIRKTLTGHKSSVTSLKVDPRGTYVMCGSNEGVVSFWDTKDFLIEKVISDVDESINCVDCSRDGTYISVTYDNLPSKIYDYTSGDTMLELNNCKGGNLVAPTFRWFSSKTAFVFTSDNCRTMTYMIKPD